MFEVRFTASVENFDTEETFNGWVSPNWNRYSLYTEREDVSVETFETREEAVAYIESVIGELETDCGSEVMGNYYAADVDINHEAGEHWKRAGHVTEVP